MGKSRSATICIAYLLHQQPSSLTPASALAILRESRPLCEPNEGFMEQLSLYHQMGCPDDVINHPIYSRWLYRREVEESVACGRGPELNSVLFEDDQSRRTAQTEDGPIEIKCRKCRRKLATTPFIIPHEPHHSRLQNPSLNSTNTECAHIFLHPLTWMRPSLFPSGTTAESEPSSGSGLDNYSSTEIAPLSGRLICPNPACGSNIGKFAWAGMQCSCGKWVVPAMGVAKARIDIVDRSKTGAGGPSRNRLPPAVMGIRLPPSMRGLDMDAGGRGGNL
ncbi:hypothetical protein MAP00_001852 [Monascus purpureus]|nr:hypothetical protein MAP00_001852 [Monascus purpureus]